ncbi:hypothetical protein CSPX01_09303 [Colletotrichum filicis]|nr:hypothetical protein CSPX01_09303 [Colletotrichum filicis]
MMTELGETTEAGGVTGSQAEVEDEPVVEAGAGTDVEAEAEVDEVDMETPAGQNNNEDMETWEP